MATVLENATRNPGVPERFLVPEQRVVLRGVGWDGYEALLKMVGDGHVRIAYDRGDAELMSPSYHHENFKKSFARLIEMLTLELDLPCQGAGSTTFRNEIAARGLEPDECYYLSSVNRVIGKVEIDLNIDPPPDLAIEIEISRSTFDRLAIYASIGVPEVWRFDGESLTISLLQPDGTYVSSSTSQCLPYLSVDEWVHWVEKADETDHTSWIRRFRDWVRAEVIPRMKNA